MEDAVLDLGLREAGVNGRIKSRQVVRAGDENVLYATVLQTIEYSRPEFGALVFSDPHTQNVLPAVQVNANSDVYRLLHDLALAADMVVDRVQKHYGVDPLQRPLLPLPHDGQDLVRDPAHGAV